MKTLQEFINEMKGRSRKSKRPLKTQADGKKRAKKRAKNAADPQKIMLDFIGKVAKQAGFKKATKKNTKIAISSFGGIKYSTKLTVTGDPRQAIVMLKDFGFDQVPSNLGLASITFKHPSAGVTIDVVKTSDEDSITLVGNTEKFVNSIS